MENLNEALFLLAIGMCMVFVILFLVVGIGNLVIILSNRYFKAPDIPARAVIPEAISPASAAIAAVVDVVTQGVGRVESVEKK